MTRLTVYLDHAATTPTDPRVVRAMLPYLVGAQGNPASTHAAGRRASTAIGRARDQIADLIGAQPSELVFTSGATESNNLALKGLAWGERMLPRRMLVSAIEHDSVRRAAEVVGRFGWEIVTIPVDRRGSLDLDALRRALERETALVSVMHANNEIGTVQPIAQIAGLVHAADAVLHVDAAQTVGHLPIRLGGSEICVDLLSLSGHKFGGPKGIGALYVRQGIGVEPIAHGGDQELNRRAGTHAVPSIVGLGAAAEIAGLELCSDGHRIEGLRRRLADGCAALGAVIHGHPTERLPGILSCSFPEIDGATLAANLDMLGVYCSTGSACHARSGERSHVLAAIDVLPEASRGTVRFSLGRSSSAEDVARALEVLPLALARARDVAP